MKTLCFSLGLLLLTLCCCDAIPKGVKFSTAPQTCCFSFKTSATPLKFVSSVAQTHSSCPKKAFIVHTVKGRQICYSQTFKWAQDLYRLHNTEGSS
ncbi:C-C motif chemokine 3-like 1 [Archocentrus centrarchus]|uniref:C-C motif chemokine 3-like 1 n=1 Tax=Archocentrus centrarchus TaxID=63155 RepID=UPI0011E9E1C5|nr:C-C motif chemokine 3-like 1 [Archocentrus centrarchus]